MFFRFYISTTICSLAVLPTSVWVVGAVILLWLISIPIKGISRYRKWKKHQAILYPNTLSFCIKSMRRQKQNFKVIEFLIRNKNLQKRFKKLSILLDDINIKVTSGYVEDLPKTYHSRMNDIYYSPSYSHYSCNIHHRSDRNH
jgi:hypothetical protein